jgi:hypothetical protein
MRKAIWEVVGFILFVWFVLGGLTLMDAWI